MDRVSCCLDWSQTLCVADNHLEFLILLFLPHWVLGSQVYATTPGLFGHFRITEPQSRHEDICPQAGSTLGPRHQCILSLVWRYQRVLPPFFPPSLFFLSLCLSSPPLPQLPIASLLSAGAAGPAIKAVFEWNPFVRPPCSSQQISILVLLYL